MWYCNKGWINSKVCFLIMVCTSYQSNWKSNSRNHIKVYFKSISFPLIYFQYKNPRFNETDNFLFFYFVLCLCYICASFVLRLCYILNFVNNAEAEFSWFPASLLKQKILVMKTFADSVLHKKLKQKHIWLCFCRFIIIKCVLEK